VGPISEYYFAEALRQLAFINSGLKCSESWTVPFMGLTPPGRRGGAGTLYLVRERSSVPINPNAFDLVSAHWALFLPPLMGLLPLHLELHQKFITPCGPPLRSRGAAKSNLRLSHYSIV
jgi:hypothetical protein